jgi:hypothetical protein
MIDMQIDNRIELESNVLKDLIEEELQEKMEHENESDK